MREYAYDEYGRYYLDDDDNRIYKATPYSAECRLLNGVLVRTMTRQQCVDGSGNDGSSRESPQADIFVTNAVNNDHASSCPSSQQQRQQYFPTSNRDDFTNMLILVYRSSLRKSLVDMAWNQPVDPVSYLEKALQHANNCAKSKIEDAKFFTQLETERKKTVRRLFQQQLDERRKLYGPKMIVSGDGWNERTPSFTNDKTGNDVHANANSLYASHS